MNNNEYKIANLSTNQVFKHMHATYNMNHLRNLIFACINICEPNTNCDLNLTLHIL